LAVTAFGFYYLWDTLAVRALLRYRARAVTQAVAAILQSRRAFLVTALGNNVFFYALAVFAHKLRRTRTIIQAATAILQTGRALAVTTLDSTLLFDTLEVFAHFTVGAFAVQGTDSAVFRIRVALAVAALGTALLFDTLAVLALQSRGTRAVTQAAAAILQTRRALAVTANLHIRVGGAFTSPCLAQGRLPTATGWTISILAAGTALKTTGGAGFPFGATAVATFWSTLLRTRACRFTLGTTTISALPGTFWWAATGCFTFCAAAVATF
jgi:hypothetical protein